MAVSIDSDQRTGRIGVTRDAGASGLLLNTPSRYAPGDRVTLTLLVPGAEQAGPRVPGSVVRVEQVDRRSELPWRYLAAVRFSEPVEGLDEALRNSPD